MQAIKVLVVDDNMVFLRAAMLALSALPQLHVVGSARSGETALSVARQQLPDLILMDVNMPGMDGFATAALMRAQGVTGKIVLVSLAQAPEVMTRKHDFVADGFISKTNFVAETEQVIGRLFQCDLSRGRGVLA